MMDRNKTQEHRRYCPECQRWVEEAELRARADGKLRHKVCDTMTAPGAPVPSEMRELADRMAADEASEGNFAAAAELRSFAEGSPDAPTGPLTPGQVMCTVCRLDDRTRAATDPNDLRCHECRDAAAGVVGTAAEDIPAGGEGTVQLGRHAVAYSLPVVGPFAAKYLVAEGAVEGRDYVVSPPLPADFALGQGTIGRWKKAEELAGPLAEAAAARVSTIDWSVLGPEVAAAVQARQHVWDAGAGSLRDCYCVRGVDHTEEPLSELQAWMNPRRAGKTRIRENLVEQALAEDIRRVPDVAGLLSSNEQEQLAKRLVELGWVPGARRRVDAVDEATVKPHPVLIVPGGETTPCCCQPDLCLGEGDPPSCCEYCAAIDGELPCPIADAEVHRG